MRLFVLRLPLLSAIALCSSLASAQQANPPPVLPPDPVAAPAPPLIRPYALIKPTIVFATAAVESFGQPNASAATAAGNPALAALPDEAQTSFQAAQSRLGFWFDEKGPVRGHFEIDFIDFTKSSPAQAAVPRLRIAAVEWQLTDTLQLSAGQDWDLFQPANSHTLNIVSVSFQAGNTGFMRHQAKLIYNDGSLELGGAVGMAGINNTARTAVPEFNQLPSLALRASMLFGAAGKVGVSALASRWRFAPDTAAERYTFAGAGGLFGDFTPAERLNIRFEAYVGRNLANTGALSLGNGNVNDDIDEAGGFLSAKYGFTDVHALYGFAGFAKVLNDEDVLPSYGYPVPATPVATASGTGPGMASNLTARLGYEYRHSKAIAVLAEGFLFNSKHVLDPMDAAVDDTRTALGAELGLLFTL